MLAFFWCSLINIEPDLIIILPSPLDEVNYFGTLSLISYVYFCNYLYK